MRLFSVLLCSALLACSATPAVVAPAPRATPAPAQPPAPAAVEPAAPRAEESPGFAEALAALHPEGAHGALQALANAPGEAAPYAQAALLYAPTNVPGMTLLWGLSYQAMGGGPADAAVAGAVAQVLRERIVAKRDESTKQVAFNLRLAPGQMPVRREADGSARGPAAHVFEMLLGPAVTGFRPPWSIEQFYDVLSTWAGLVASHGTPLDAVLELNPWLVTLAKAGHLEAFCYQLLGPAFPAELKAYQAANPTASKAYLGYSKLTPLRPKHAVMPDDLVRVE